MTRWTDFVKDFAKRHNLSYGCALSDKRCSEEYKQYKIPKLTAKEKRESNQMGMEDINRAGHPFRNPEKEELRLMGMEDINRAGHPFRNPEKEELRLMSMEDINRSRPKKKVKKIIQIREASPSPPPSPKSSPKSTYTEYELKNMYVKDLRELVKKLGLKLSYADVKAELITQILKHTQDTTSERAKSIVHKKNIVNTLYPSQRYKELNSMKLDRLKILARGYKIPYKDADKHELIRLILRRENIGLVPRAKYRIPFTREQNREYYERQHMMKEDALLQKKINQELEQMGMEDKPLKYIPADVELQNIMKGFNRENKKDYVDRILKINDLIKRNRNLGLTSDLGLNDYMIKLGHLYLKKFGRAEFDKMRKFTNY